MTFEARVGGIVYGMTVIAGSPSMGGAISVTTTRMSKISGPIAGGVALCTIGANPTMG